VDELVGADDGTCHELGEEADVEAVVEEVGERRYASAVDVHQVADALEGVERDADGEPDDVDAKVVGTEDGVAQLGEVVADDEIGAEDLVHHVDGEVGVLEIAEDDEVYDDARGDPQLGGQWGLGVLGGVFDAMPDAQTDDVGEDGGDDEEGGEDAGGLVIEEDGDEEEESVSHEDPALPDEGEGEHDESEEGPEVELGEEEGVLVVESEDVVEDGAGGVDDVI